MKEHDLWPLALETLVALQAHYGPAIDHAAEELGIPVGEWYGWLMAARLFAPDPVSAERLHVRSAYMARARLDAILAGGAEMALLEPQGGGAYRLTPAGQVGVAGLIRTAYDAMAELRPLPQSALLRLAELLKRLVEASLAAPEPPGKWCLRIARRYDGGEDAPVMERLDQYLSDLSAYRDDAHLAAWQPLDVSGQAWEAFTLLWRGAAQTLDAVCATLARRGFTRADYAAALQELSARGWIAQDAAGYALTEAGRAVRQQAETTTDAYFYAPWGTLSAGETAELRTLLIELRDGLMRRPA